MSNVCPINSVENRMFEAARSIADILPSQAKQNAVAAPKREERWATVEEYNAPRPAPTAEELREARALVLDSEDRVIVARSALEQLQSAATSATAAANRATDRRVDSRFVR
jgi:hypothetical protein